MLCDIAGAFLHNPKIIFLDEPTIGLDVNIKARMRSMIRYLNQTMKTTVVLTTHDTGDIEELADRIILIDKGKILYDGEAEAFHHIFGAYKTIKVKLKDTDLASVPQAVERISNALANVPDVKVQEQEAGWIQVVVNDELTNIDEVIKTILEVYKCKDLMINDVELASVLQRVYNGDVDISVRRKK
jgi:ABC-2 type transport system ATP-binding protein